MAAVQYLTLLLGISAVAALIVLQFEKDESPAPDATTLALLFFGAILVAAAVAPRVSKQALSRLSSLKVGGVEVALVEVDLAVRATPLWSSWRRRGGRRLDPSRQQDRDRWHCLSPGI